jgi:hypothetical protein
VSDPSVTGLVGVYDADGSLLGEAAYVWGRMRGTRHCALCDITHGRVRRKAAWDRMVAGLGVPVELLHLDELPPDVAAATAESGVPVLLARTAEGLRPLVGAAELDGLDGSVDRLGDLLRSRLAADRA